MFESWFCTRTVILPCFLYISFNCIWNGIWDALFIIIENNYKDSACWWLFLHIPNWFSLPNHFYKLQEKFISPDWYKLIIYWTLKIICICICYSICCVWSTVINNNFKLNQWPRVLFFIELFEIHSNYEIK